MRRASLVRWSVTFCVATTVVPCHGQDNRFSAPGKEVTVLTANPRGSAKKPLFDVTVAYKFEGRNSVWLQGVGTLPASGETEYSLRGSRIVFFDKKGGNRLATLDVAATEVKQSPPLGNPYPSTVQGWTAVHPARVAIGSIGVWDSLVKTLNEVYDQRMGSTPCRPDDEGCLLTQWTTVSAPVDLKQVQMSVMITYAITETTHRKALSLKIFYILRQAPVGEALHWDYQIDESTHKMGLAKIARLQERLAQLTK
jgi:hypothetical protein